MSAETLLELLRQRERHNARPLVIVHAAGHEPPSEAEIRAAQQAGFPVMHVYFARLDGDGHPASSESAREIESCAPVKRQAGSGF